jgi:hypothetical protein
MNTRPAPAVLSSDDFGGAVRLSPSSAGSTASAALHGRVTKRRHKSRIVSRYPSLSNLAAFAGEPALDRDEVDPAETAPAAQEVPKRLWRGSLPHVRQSSPWEVYCQWRESNPNATKAACRVFAERALSAITRDGPLSERIDAMSLEGL